MTRVSQSIVAVAAGLAVSCACGCRSHVPETVTCKVLPPVIGGEAHAMPPAIVYMVSGGDCGDLVPIALTADGRGVLSYPDPSDLGGEQTPIALGDGWWLDRRGIGPTSVFTTYTYERYAALGQAPDVVTLMGHIDHGIRITRMFSLPVSAAEAASDPSVARVYVEGGFKGCEELLDRK